VTDIVVSEGGYMRVLAGNGAGSFTLSAPLNPSSAYPWFKRELPVIGDFNGDGTPDLAFESHYTQSPPITEHTGLGIALGTGGGAFASPTWSELGVLYSIVAADLDGDGHLDLVAAANASVILMFGAGDGTFGTPVTLPVNANPVQVAVGHIADKHVPDIVTANSDGTVSFLRGHGDGTFEPQITYVAGSTLTSLAIGDFNGDHRDDVAVSDQGAGDIVVLLNGGDGSLYNVGTIPSGGLPVSVLAADVDHDGLNDMIVANRDGTVDVLFASCGGQ
jgi:hypothetical protein